MHLADHFSRGSTVGGLQYVPQYASVVQAVSEHLDLREPACTPSLRAHLGQEHGHFLRIDRMAQARQTPIPGKELDQTPIGRQEHDWARSGSRCRAALSCIVAAVDLLKVVRFCEGHHHSLIMTYRWGTTLQRVQDLALIPRLIVHVLDSHCCDVLAGPHRRQHLVIKELLHMVW